MKWFGNDRGIHFHTLVGICHYVIRCWLIVELLLGCRRLLGFNCGSMLERTTLRRRDWNGRTTDEVLLVGQTRFPLGTCPMIPTRAEHANRLMFGQPMQQVIDVWAADATSDCSLVVSDCS